MSLIFIVTLSLPSLMVFPDASNDEQSKIFRKSIIVETIIRLKNIVLNKTVSSTPIEDYINTKTHKDCIIASQTMNIYKFKRKVMQINPLSLKSIYLTDSPDKIISMLINLNVSYVHFSPYPGYIPGLTKKLDKFSINLNGIKKLPQLELILRIDLGNNKYEELYKIH